MIGFVRVTRMQVENRGSVEQIEDLSGSRAHLVEMAVAGGQRGKPFALHEYLPKGSHPS